MADSYELLLTKDSFASTSLDSEVKSTVGLEELTFNRIVTAISGVGCTFDLKIQTTNVADTTLWSTAAYWTDLITNATFGQVITGASVPAVVYKTVIDNGAFKEAGAFYKAVVTIGSPGTVSFRVWVAYKLRV